MAPLKGYTVACSRTSSSSSSPSTLLSLQPALSTPLPYHTALTPARSSLRPHCLARDRLRLWIPLASCTALDINGHSLNVSPTDLDQILAVISVSWAET